MSAEQELLPKPERALMSGMDFDERGGLAIRTLEEALLFAQMILTEKLAPRGYKTRGQIVIAMQAGAEVGLKPMTALKYMVPINDTPTLWGEGAKGLVFRSGLVAAWEEEWIDAQGIMSGDPVEFAPEVTAVTRGKRKGTEGWVERRFSVADAKRAKLWGRTGPWTDYPQRMLRVRSMAWLMRDLWADCLGGLSIAEEVLDTPRERRAAEYRDVQDLLPAAAPVSPAAASEPSVAPPPPEEAPEFPWGSTDPEAP